MEQQVLSIGKCKKLIDAGIKPHKASVFWHKILSSSGIFLKRNWFTSFDRSPKVTSDKYETIPAFTLQDLLDLLPVSIKDGDRIYELRIKRMIFGGEKVMYSVLYEEQYSIDWYIMYSYPNLLDAAYEMLCWCADEGYIETKKVK